MQNIETEEFLKRRDAYYLRFANEKIAEEYVEFLKNRLQHFSRLDDTFAILNDDEEMHTQMIEWHNKYDLFIHYNKDTKIAYTNGIRGIELYLLIELRRFWLNEERILWIMKEFQEKYTRKPLSMVYKFYLSMVFKKLTVNLYIYNDFLAIKSLYEQTIQIQEHPVLIGRDLIQISLNSLVTALFDEDYVNTIDKFYLLWEKEWDVIQEIRDDAFKKDKVNIELKNWDINFIETIWREEDLDKFKELSIKYPHCKIGFEQFDGQKQHITIATRKKY